MSDEPLDFSLDLVKVPVKLGGVDYVLREATGDIAVEHQNMLTRAVKLGNDGKPSSIGDVGNVEPYLISRCLFKFLGDDKGLESVRLESIRLFPAHVVKTLYRRILKISRMETEETKADLEKRLKETQEKLAALLAADGSRTEADTEAKN